MLVEVQQLTAAVKALETQRARDADDGARIVASQRTTIETLRKENKQLQEQLDFAGQIAGRTQVSVASRFEANASPAKPT